MFIRGGGGGIEVAGLIQIRLGSLSAPSSRKVHSGSLGFALARQVVVGFIRVRVGSLVCA